jgi:predicted molibdopterin-dependent oxidoreductase YjgC
VGNEAARRKFARAWQVDDLSHKNGLMIPQMIEGLRGQGGKDPVICKRVLLC